MTMNGLFVFLLFLLLLPPLLSTFIVSPISVNRILLPITNHPILDVLHVLSLHVDVEGKYYFILQM